MHRHAERAALKRNAVQELAGRRVDYRKGASVRACDVDARAIGRDCDARRLAADRYRGDRLAGVEVEDAQIVLGLIGDERLVGAEGPRADEEQRQKGCERAGDRISSPSRASP